MRFATLLAGLLSVLTLASCQGYVPDDYHHDRSINDTGMYGGQKGNFPSGKNVGMRK